MKKTKRAARKTLGIIGFGAFGQLAARQLKQNFEVQVFDTDLGKKREAQKMGVTSSSLEKVCESDFILLAVPISKIEVLLQKIKKLVKPGTVVFDACSVKTKPCRLMKRNFAKNIEIIGTHPLFGPQSAANGIKGLTIVLCPVRISEKKVSKTKAFLQGMGLKVVEMAAQEHDRQMAETQVLTHFIAKALARIAPEKSSLGLKSFDRLMEGVAMVKGDSPQLFHDLQTANPFARKARGKLLKTLEAIDKRLSRNKEGN